LHLTHAAFKHANTTNTLFYVSMKFQNPELEIVTVHLISFLSMTLPQISEKDTHQNRMHI